MAVINGIEAHERAKKSPVRLDNATSKQVSTFRQTLFKFFERFKNSAAGNFVRPLARGETSSVNAVVYIVVQKGRELRVLGFDVFWKKIQILILSKVIKHVVEHATDVVLAIVDDPLRFLVPEDRHGHALIEMRIGCFVSFA